jgi:ketosteroid isomerase-like protein
VLDIGASNVEVVRRLNDVFNERSFGENADLLDPDIVWDMSRVQVPDGAALTGRLGILEFLDAWTESFASEHIDAEEIVDGGDQVLVTVRHSGRGKVSGIEVDQRYAMVWTLRDGRAVRMEMYLTRDEALEAMGLGE